MTTGGDRRRETLFQRRRRRFLEDGFTPAEARWAAGRKLRLGDPTVKAVRNARRRFVQDYQKAFGATRKQAIEAARRALTDRNRIAGLTGSNVYNIFKEISPF